MNFLYLILLLMLLTPNPANAQRLEFSAGHTNYHSTDGVWYDSLSGDYSNNLRPQSWLLSLRSQGWKASFVYLGDANNQAQWGAYEHGDELANPSLLRTSVYGARGSGRIYGISLAKAYERDFHGMHFGIEGGPFLYHTEWHEVFWPLADPSQVGHDDTTHNNITLYAGGGIRYKVFYAELRYYYQIQDGLIGRNARQVTLGLSIPFGGDK